MRSNERGFTLLEFIIAFALLIIILAAAYLAQSSSLASSVRTRNLLMGTNLARNLLAESETKMEGLSFDTLSKEESGNFSEPNNQFKWKKTISEVDFSALSEIFSSQFKTEGQQGVSEEQSIVAKLFEAYMKKSVRKLEITVEWPEGAGTNSVSFSLLLVNYDAEFGVGG